MPERSWNLTRPGLGKVLSCRFCACSALFDRPADERALEALLKPPVIDGLTESLADLSPTDWRYRFLPG